MFPRQKRITKNEEFRDVYRLGRVFSVGMANLAVKKNNSNDVRFAVVAGIKFSKKAVERNRIKRQIRAILANLKEKIAPGNDIVVNVKKVQMKPRISSLEIKKDIENALKKARLIS